MSKRFEILKAVAANPGAPAAEIAETIGGDLQKTTWNVRECVKAGLLSKRLDDITRQPGYTLTAEGKQRLAEETAKRPIEAKTTGGDSEGGETDAPAAVKESLTAAPAEVPPPQYDPNEVAFAASVNQAEVAADWARLDTIARASETLAPCVPGAIDTSDMDLQEIAEAVAEHVADLAAKLGRAITDNEAMREELVSLRELNAHLDAALQKARKPDFVLAPPDFERIQSAVGSATRLDAACDLVRAAYRLGGLAA